MFALNTYNDLINKVKLYVSTSINRRIDVFIIGTSKHKLNNRLQDGFPSYHYTLCSFLCILTLMFKVTSHLMI